MELQSWLLFCLVIDSQVFLDLENKDMKQINALFQEVIINICCTSWDK